MEKLLTFDELPASLVELHRKVDILLTLNQNKSQSDQDKYLTILELIEYLPEHPARQTIYGWVNQRFVPFEKHGKKLYFRKSFIDVWLSNGRKTN